VNDGLQSLVWDTDSIMIDAETSFNIVVGNHAAMYRESLSDIVTFVEEGLRSLGVAVRYSTRTLAPAPCINLLVEQFGEPAFCDRLEELFDAHGEHLRVGLVGSEDLDDTYVMHGPRSAGLCRLAPRFEFVWTMTPQVEEYRRLCGHDRVALLELGFIENDRTEAAVRDIDVLWYGREGSRVQAYLAPLRARGLHVVSTGGEASSYERRNLLRRAKVIIDCRTHASDRFLSATRICAGLNAGAAVVAERFDESTLARLYDYTIAADAGELVDVADGLVSGGGWRAVADRSQKVFRARRPMSVLLQQALGVVPDAVTSWS
jgi:hypothetical protein